MHVCISPAHTTVAIGAHASTAFVFGPEEAGPPFEYLGCFPATSHLMYHAEVRLR